MPLPSGGLASQSPIEGGFLFECYVGPCLIKVQQPPTTNITSTTATYLLRVHDYTHRVTKTSQFGYPLSLSTQGKNDLKTPSVSAEFWRVQKRNRSRTIRLSHILLPHTVKLRMKSSHKVA